MIIICKAHVHWELFNIELRVSRAPLFLNLSSLNIWGQIILRGRGGYPVYLYLRANVYSALLTRYGDPMGWVPSFPFYR